MDFPADFKPQQILCLQHQEMCLYVEVVQFVAVRQLCWVRPLALTIASNGSDPQLYDLRQTADLLWTAQHFRAALDTEVIPFLAQLSSAKPPAEGNRSARQRLQTFLKQVWQADRT